MNPHFRVRSVLPWAATVVLATACGGGSKSTPSEPDLPIRLPQTGQTVSKAAGDDASSKQGVAWPSPRFRSADDGDTMVDRLTGLMWAASNTPLAECGWRFTEELKDTKTWEQAFSYVACLNARSYLGHADWRMPNRWEMRSLLQNDGLICEDGVRLGWLQAQGFRIPSVERDQNLTEFVTSTAAPNSVLCVLSEGRRPLWAVDLCGATYADASDLQQASRGVWPVRDAEGVEAVARLPATGVSTCYAWTGCDRRECAGTGQDAETREGVAWPSPRFVPNADTTITDRLTGLHWAPNGNFPNPDPTGYPAAVLWQGALNTVDDLNEASYLGHDDWRLPNINELASLALGDTEESYLFELLQGYGLPVKGNTLADPSVLYWSSTWGTTVTDGTSSQDAVWMMGTALGNLRLSPVTEESRGQVLPVRGP